ncbi:hypothetical protein C8F04DRAFT_1393461 [Mycena alexandri]|uniref:Uncharacterized protein n=1 Tax=Mycena alexandri TaxID=1745969 RepID=A0AAD6X7H9_9AGAR|nr:hypothetical protein C8F04DRAFT_1393461 [Mycena alexandri]
MSFPSKDQSPPAYSPRSSPPTYSSTSRPTERTLHRSRGRSQSPTGVFVRCSGDVALTIFGFAFSQRFPSVFRHDGRLCNLPPTCHITFGSLHFIKCVYHITVVATSVRHRPASFLTRSDSVSFDLTYRPRTSPARPLLSNPSIYGTIKTCPEEWMQASHMVELSGQHDAPSLICDLFAPAVGAFCILEPIPFHL